MKKFSLIVVGLLLTLLSYSQDFNRVIRATKSIFKNDKEWVVVQTYYPTDMFIIMKDWDITIGTYKLKTYDQPEKTTYDDHITYTWKCVDSDGQKCFFMMKKFKPEITTHLLHSVVYTEQEVMYEYETE
jgi:ABC-type proline/glycine betaine transport system substrate-binding protein